MFHFSNDCTYTPRFVRAQKYSPLHRHINIAFIFNWRWHNTPKRGSAFWNKPLLLNANGTYGKVPIKIYREQTASSEIKMKRPGRGKTFQAGSSTDMLLTESICTFIFYPTWNRWLFHTDFSNWKSIYSKWSAELQYVWLFSLWHSFHFDI